MTPFLLLSILQKAIYPHRSFQSPTPFLSLCSFFSGICHQSVTFRFRNFSVSRLLSIFGGLRFRFRRIWSWKKGSVSENKSRYQFWSNFWSQCIPIDHIWLADFPTMYFHQFCHGRQQAVVTSQMGVKNVWATISMRSDNLQLTCIQPPNSLQILPWRLFK